MSSATAILESCRTALYAVAKRRVGERAVICESLKSRSTTARRSCSSPWLVLCGFTRSVLSKVCQLVAGAIDKQNRFSEDAAQKMVLLSYPL